MVRFRLWTGLLTSSIVSLVSLLSVLDDRNQTDWLRSQSWSVSVCSISTLLAFCGALTSLLSSDTVKKAELPLILVALIFWCAGLPTIVDPNDNLAVSPDGAISNANLFFFSYGSLVFSILLLASWVEERNRNNEKGRNKHALMWVLLAAFSLIAMSSSTTSYRDRNCKDNIQLDDRFIGDYCQRTRFGIFGGLASLVMALIVLAIRHRASTLCQAISAFLLTILWACGVAFLTFGNGPATNMGSLYFATWVTFFVSLDITSICVMDYISEENIRVVKNTHGMPVKVEKDEDGSDVKKNDEEDPAEETTKEQTEKLVSSERSDEEKDSDKDKEDVEVTDEETGLFGSKKKEEDDKKDDEKDDKEDDEKDEQEA